MKSNKITISVLIVLVLILFVVTKILSKKETGAVGGQTPETSVIVATGTPPQTDIVNTGAEISVTKVTANKSQAQIIIKEQKYDFDPSNIEQLVKHSSKVFVGTVVKRLADVLIDGVNRPTFQIQGVTSIKGGSASLVVQMDVGYKDENTYITRDADSVSGVVDPANILLQIGATYVFATSKNNSLQDSISAVPYDRFLITTETFSISRLADLASQDRRVQEFKNVTEALGQTYKFQESFQ